MPTFAHTRLLALAAVAGLLCTACTDSYPGAPQNTSAGRGVILVHFGPQPATAVLAALQTPLASPATDRLFSRAALFDRTVAQHADSLPAAVTLFTGVYPQEHQVLTADRIISQQLVTVAEHFAAHGFHTIGHTAGGVFSRAFGLHRGFDEFSVRERRGMPAVQEILAAAIDSLRGLDGRRFFLFLHAPYAGKVLRDGQAHAVARQFVAFLAQLEEMGLLEESTVAITSGPRLRGRHDEAEDDTYLHAVDLVSPILISPPGGGDGMQTVDAVVESLDLAPTLYELAGLPPARYGSGKSLVPYLDNPLQARLPQRAYAEAAGPPDQRALFSLADGRPFELITAQYPKEADGTWVTRFAAFDVSGDELQLDAVSFHTKRQIEIAIDGAPHSPVLLGTRWTTMTLPLPGSRAVHRVEMQTTACDSPKKLKLSSDSRCLSFKLRGPALTRTQLFDLEHDPSSDIAAERPELVAEVREAIDRMRWQPVARADRQAIDNSLRRRLHAMGYLP